MAGLNLQQTFNHLTIKLGKGEQNYISSPKVTVKVPEKERSHPTILGFWNIGVWLQIGWLSFNVITCLKPQITNRYYSSINKLNLVVKLFFTNHWKSICIGSSFDRWPFTLIMKASYPLWCVSDCSIYLHVYPMYIDRHDVFFLNSN